MHGLRQDAAFAIRILRRQALAAATAALCVAIGIGATTTMFSVYNTLLLRPLPYPNGERLMVVGAAREGDHNFGATSYLVYRDWRERQHVFTALAAVGQTDLTVAHNGAERVTGALVSANLPRTLGVEPEAGRFFLEAEDRPGAPSVMVVSHGFAEREFGGARGALGQSLLVSGTRREIVGIIPDRWRYPSRADIWIPLARDVAHEQRDNRNTIVLGAVRPGVTVDVARRELAAIARDLAALYPRTDKGFTAIVTPIRDQILGDARGSLLMMVAAALLVLAVACANVAALQLARATTRTREMAVRVALGATRGRLVRQLLAESVLLALLGGAAGCLLADLGHQVVALAIAPRTPAWMTFDLDARSLGFALLVSTMTGLLFGIAPAIRLSAASHASALRGGASGAPRTRLQRVFVAVEIALSIVLVVGAALAVESFRAVERIPLGFDPSGVLTFRMVMQGHRYDERSARAQFVDAVERALGGLPGTVAVGAASLPPVDGCCAQFLARIEGDDSEHPPMITGTIVTPGYFRAMGITLLAGRAFMDVDRLDMPPVTVVNETFARRYWPNGSAIGRHVDTGAGNATIVGVVRDIKQTSLLDTPEPQFYRPYAADPWTNMTFAIRTRVIDPAQLTTDLRRAVQALDPAMPIFNVRTMTEVVGLATASSRTFGAMLTIFAVIALLLAAAGVYAVTSFFVTQRARELGVRVALGADPVNLATLVLRQSAALTAIGLGVGLGCSMMAAVLLARTLYGVRPADPFMYTAAVLLIGATSVVATYSPARRASKIDPMIALRSE